MGKHSRWPETTNGKPETKKKSVNPLYEGFHGANPNTRKVNLPVPKKGAKLSSIGKLVSVTYQPYGNSRLKTHQFRHVMGDTGTNMLPDKPILATDGNHLYIIPDKSKMRFTDRGIVG